MKITTVIPTYPECDDTPRCIAYLSLARDYALKREPTWDIEIRTYQGVRFGDGRTWSHERDREIGRCRDEGIHAGYDTGADWIAMQDADVMVPEDYYWRMAYLPMNNTLAKTAKVFNVESGSFRFVNAQMAGVWEVDNKTRRTDYASEVLWMHRSAVERLPRPYFKAENNNEDYELCRVLKGLGVDIYIAPVECIAT